MADTFHYGGTSGVLAVVSLLQVVWLIPDVTAIPSCSFPVQDCGNLSFTNLAEYVISPASSQFTVCLASNSTSYSLPSSAAAVRFNRTLDNNNNPDSQFCSSISLDSSFACSSNSSSTFPDQLTLFVSLEELAKRDRESIDFNITGGDGVTSGQFSLNHAPRGIYPLSGNNLASVILGEGVELQWLSYETDQLDYTYIDANGNTTQPTPGDKSLTSWSPPCVPPTANESFSITPEVPQLVTVSIASAQIQDGGTYSVTGEGGVESSIDLTIKETGPPVLITDDDQVIFKQINLQADISCGIEHDTNTRPSWYFNNVPIVNNCSIYYIRTTSLRIFTMTMERGGWYTCVASNAYGTTMKDILVVPSDPPSIVVDNPLPSGMNYSVISGSTVVLPCLATGLPPPRIRWFAGSDQLSHEEGKITIHPVTGTLVLTNFTVEDNNEFSCRAENSANHIIYMKNSSSTSVGVTTGTNVSPSVPSQVVYSLDIDETANLTCPSSDIATSVAWYQNGSLFEHEQTTLTITGSSNGSPEGVYCCRTNSSSLLMPVTQCYTVYMQLSATISSNLINASVQANRNISYFVSTETPNNLDQPVLNWLYQSSLIDASTDGLDLFQNVQGVSTLIVRQADSSTSGQYSIEGSNSADTYMTSSEIQVVDIGIEDGLLNSGGGEGVDTEVMGHWGLVQGDGTASLSPSGAETHFSLSPNSSIPRPRITQAVTLDNIAGQMQVLLSCRMRSSAPNSILPQVTLSINTIPSTSKSVTPPYSALDSWQWVTMTINFTAETDANVTVSVTMETYEVNDVIGSVYFDDFHLQVLPLAPSLSVVPSSTQSTMPSSTPTKPGIKIGDYLPFVYIGAGAVGSVMILMCCMTFCYCCCCIKRRRMKKSKRMKSPLLNELEKSLDNGHITLKSINSEPEVSANDYAEHQETRIDEATEKTVGELKKSAPQDIPNESQPVYILPGETPIYVDGNGTNHLTVKEEDKKRLSVSYDYPGIVKGQEAALQGDKDSYDYARASSMCLERRANPAERKKSAPEIVLPVGSVKRISKRFESMKEDSIDSPEENEYDTCKLQIDTSKPWHNSNRDRSISMVSNTTGSSVAKKKEGVERKWSDPGLITSDDDLYDNFNVDNDNYDNIQIGEDGIMLPASYTGKSPVLSPTSRQKNTSITQMPLPSIPTDGDQDVYTSPTTKSPPAAPVDGSGYLTIQNTNKSPDEENPYYKSLLSVDSNGTYERPIQSPKLNSEEEDPYANDGLDGSQGNENPSLYDDPSYDYCSLSKMRPNNKQDATYVITSLEDESNLLKDSEEPIYY